MKFFFKPKWLFLINTVPLIILFFLLWNEYSIIKSLLKPENKVLWIDFSIALFVLWILNFSYILYSFLKKINISKYYGIVALLTYIPYIYIYANNINKIVPTSIPQWMISGNVFLYVGTFLMPTLAYALFLIVNLIPPAKNKNKVWFNFLFAILIPISGYLFVQLILPFWNSRYINNSDFEEHLMIILVITATVAFLFFLVRAVYILSTRKTKNWNKYQLAWKIPISLVFPILGLALNNGELKEFFDNIFGDFSNIWFYILAIANAVFICLPNSENKFYRLFLFVARSLTFVYTFYFFLVFLPFLPLSVIAIIAMGSGFLMLTPLLLFIIHIKELATDFQFLKNYFSKNIVRAIFVMSFLTIPVFITLTYYNDKIVLNKTLSYLYSPDYLKDYKLNKSSIERTINVVKQHKITNRNSVFMTHIPYFTAYYNWLVLDNLTLSNSKINTIENVFLGKVTNISFNDNIRNEGVEISEIKTESKYDKEQNAWLSWVDIEITNKDTSNWRSNEYATTFELLDGCWISDYYLYVGDRKEMGILAEKKSAMWIFSQIRGTNRDPGLLHYLTGNKIAFRVFPFTDNEVRQTGIQIIHKEPFIFNIDTNKVLLGNYEQQNKIIKNTTEDKNVIYVSKTEKQSLQEVQRTPYYHFIIDIANNRDGGIDEYINNVETFLEKNPLKGAKHKISYTNSYVETEEFSENWHENLKKQTFEGGFYLERAIKKILVKNMETIEDRYPIIVVVSNQISNSVLEKDFADFKMAFPENDFFYSIDFQNNINVHSLINKPKSIINSTPKIIVNKVLAYPNTSNPIAYLRNDSLPSIVIKEINSEIDEDQIKEKNWETALLLQANWYAQVFKPTKSDKTWYKSVKYSFISKIMTPVTSYLVVENDAQKEMLKKKQKQVLAGNKSLDVSDDVSRMTEPKLFLLLIFVALFLLIRKFRKKA